MSVKNLNFVDFNAPKADAEYLNTVRLEVNNIITSSNQSLLDSDNLQTSKAVSVYATKGDFYKEAGGSAADVYVLENTDLIQQIFELRDGMRIRFRIVNTNTGNSTVNINSLGAKTIEFEGNNITAGTLTVGDLAEIVYNLSGDIFELIPSLSQPVASVIQMAISTVPVGYLQGNGQAVSRTTFARLFSIIGIQYGDGDTTTTFNVPDYSGYLLRGFDNGAGNDPDSGTRTDRGDGTTGDNVGTKQDYATALPVTDFTTDVTGDHMHNVQHDGMQGANFTPDEAVTVITGALNKPTTFAGDHSHSVTGGGDNETRPKNIYVMFCIKT